MIRLIVFITGAAVMVLELLGSRILAPFVGSSLLVWTNLIGIILASLSFGYWLGGQVADRVAKLSMVGRLLILAATTVSLTRIIYEPLLAALQETGLTLHTQALLGSIILFVVPSTLLAMVSPYAVRLTLQTVNTSGSTVGRLSALATLGSIIGTFSAGLWLIPTFGTKMLLVLLAAVLLVLALPVVITQKREAVLWVVALALTVIAAHTPSFLHVTDVDTAYSHIWIQDVTLRNGNHLRLFRQNHDLSSGMDLDHPDQLVFPYTQAYELAFSYQPAIQHSLLIGGAAYSYPKYYLKAHPTATMDVVEIDPAVTTLAQQYFQLALDPRLRIFHQDARIFLNTTYQQYDAIFVDAFNSETIPFHLTTREVVAQTKRLLSDQGQVVMNIIGSVTGTNSRFLWAEYATYQTLYPFVTIYQVDPTVPRDQTQNVMLIAHRSAPVITNNPTDQTVARALSGLVDKPLTTEQVLTDDFAPVEYLVARAVTNPN